jgi:DNA-binding NarL/FixJ family response regulator
LLLIGDERAQLERLRGAQHRERAESSEQARQPEFQARRDDAIPRLLGMGLSAEQVAEALSLSVEEVRQNTGE